MEFFVGGAIVGGSMFCLGWILGAREAESMINTLKKNTLEYMDSEKSSEPPKENSSE